MALVTISGFPSSGKSRRAQQLKDSLENLIKDESYEGPLAKVVVLSDDTLNLNRSAYDSEHPFCFPREQRRNAGKASKSEKPARGTLFTAMQRQMASDTVLIVDAPNYIKGFRYQMYCAAREMKLRVCTVYVVATQDQCREWNTTREDGKAYAPETLENLIFRYEEPSSMVRWDSPLFTVLWEDETPPMSQIWEALTKGVIKPPNSGTLAVAKAPSDALHTLEQTTAALVSAIVVEQSGMGGQLNLSFTVGSSSLKQEITLPPRNITLSELQRLKRSFVTVHKKAITLGTTEKGTVDWSEESVAEKFVTYLEEHIKPW